MPPEDGRQFLLGIDVLIFRISARLWKRSLGKVRRFFLVGISLPESLSLNWLNTFVSGTVCMQGVRIIRSFNATPVCQYDAALECRGDCQALKVSWLGTYHMEALLEKYKLGASDNKSWRDNENIR